MLVTTRIKQEYNSPHHTTPRRYALKNSRKEMYSIWNISRGEKKYALCMALDTPCMRVNFWGVTQKNTPRSVLTRKTAPLAEKNAVSWLSSTKTPSTVIVWKYLPSQRRGFKIMLEHLWVNPKLHYQIKMAAFTVLDVWTWVEHNMPQKLTPSDSLRKVVRCIWLLKRALE